MLFDSKNAFLLPSIWQGKQYTRALDLFWKLLGYGIPYCPTQGRVDRDGEDFDNVIV